MGARPRMAKIFSPTHPQYDRTDSGVSNQSPSRSHIESHVGHEQNGPFDDARTGIEYLKYASNNDQKVNIEFKKGLHKVIGELEHLIKEYELKIFSPTHPQYDRTDSGVVSNQSPSRSHIESHVGHEQNGPFDDARTGIEYLKYASNNDQKVNIEFKKGLHKVIGELEHLIKEYELVEATLPVSTKRKRKRDNE